MFTAFHDPQTGEFLCVIRANKDGTQSSIAPGSNQWDEFVAWNDNQAVKLSISNREPGPPPRDIEREQIEAILAKADSEVTSSELKTVVLKSLRRQIARGL